jgi:hypothetical protein
LSSVPQELLADRRDGTPRVPGFYPHTIADEMLAIYAQSCDRYTEARLAPSTAMKRQLVTEALTILDQLIDGYMKPVHRKEVTRNHVPYPTFDPTQGIISHNERRTKLYWYVEATMQEFEKRRSAVEVILERNIWLQSDYRPKPFQDVHAKERARNSPFDNSFRKTK